MLAYDGGAYHGWQIQSDADGQPAPVITAPYNLPAYTPVRDNATIEVAQASTPDGEPGGFVTFTTPDAPRALGDFYKTRLSREFGAVTDAANGPARLLSATRDANERVEVSVSPAAEGGARVTISYFLPPGLPPQSEH